MNYGVIMAGGKGTRFWPASTDALPKQFLAIGSAKSLLRQTYERIRPVVAKRDRLYVVGNTRYYRMTCRELPELPARNIVSEPCGRNTAPCIALASHLIAKRDPEAVVAVLPADHVVGNTPHFQELLAQAVKVAADSAAIVTLGIMPKSPHTGYGYIKVRPQTGKQRRPTVQYVERFVEKPTLTRARRYLQEGGYYWNAGIFVFRAQVMNEMIRMHLPKLYAAIAAITGTPGSAVFTRSLAKAYARIDAISIDYGIMEKMTDLRLVAADVAWNDVGNWDACAAVAAKDECANAIIGTSAVCIDSMRNVVMTSGKLVGLLDVHDLVVVESEDGILVASRRAAERVKELQVRIAMRKKYR